ncbi:MAG TPA: DoxX family membrane protein [Candidatus Acidoferrales bacterium]|nr:DoxX family membrane protein [Candidatus Acidoferrales bacterium]
MKLHLGRHVLGVAAIALGVFTIIWHDFYGLQQIAAVINISHPAILAYIAAAAEIFGGVAIQFPKTARAGAIALAAVFTVFALFMLPLIVKHPKIFGYWDGFFEPFSQAAGALIIWATVTRSDPAQPSKLARFAYLSFGVCVVSFTIAQIVYFAHTAELVPKWLPPGQNFWAVATTIAFGLSSLALLSRRVALLASRLLTAMILGFWVLVWLPISFATPHSMENWSENVVTLSVAGAAWIVADHLHQRRSASPSA